MCGLLVILFVFLYFHGSKSIINFSVFNELIWIKKRFSNCVFHYMKMSGMELALRWPIRAELIWSVLVFEFFLEIPCHLFYSLKLWLTIRFLNEWRCCWQWLWWIVIFFLIFFLLDAIEYVRIIFFNQTYALYANEYRIHLSNLVQNKKSKVKKFKNEFEKNWKMKIISKSKKFKLKL